MRKELDPTYIKQDDGSLVVRARTPGGEIVENLVDRQSLNLDVDYTDEQGSPRVARIVLEPQISNVLRVDEILPKDYQLHFLAARNCYSGSSDEELLLEARNIPRKEADNFLDKNIVKPGHWSVLEHARYVYLISGISRVCSHQMVRHRHISCSQQSQRYTDPMAVALEGQEGVFTFVIPPQFRYEQPVVEEYLKSMKEMMSRCLSFRARGAKPEDVRFLFPNAATTRIVMSGNLRMWMELIPKRICATAQQEIDMVVTQVAEQLWEGLSYIGNNIGPACSKGSCNQGKRNCGKSLGKSITAFFGDEIYPHDSLIFGMR
ncbi:MAG: FAD-dependent thymidylate synthase [Candidatus Shapirobacteria bacterium]